MGRQIRQGKYHSQRANFERYDPRGRALLHEILAFANWRRKSQNGRRDDRNGKPGLQTGNRPSSPELHRRRDSLRVSPNHLGSRTLRPGVSLRPVPHPITRKRHGSQFRSRRFPSCVVRASRKGRDRVHVDGLVCKHVLRPYAIEVG